MVTFEQVSKALSDLDIKRVENRIGVTLPQSLKAHYLKHNGGVPVPNSFWKDGEWYSVQQFLPMITDNRNSGFEQTYEALVEGTPEFPRGYIPFAVDDAGDYFLYSVRPDTFGEISINQSDYVNDANRFVIFLCSSLETFVSSLAMPESK
jgi:cell wall assembly regulator SMI1